VSFSADAYLIRFWGFLVFAFCTFKICHILTTLYKQNHDFLTFCKELLVLATQNSLF
jgi:hypothetical protein